ncbi:MAG: hypothetical protein KatS3mg077_2428 [Candidatus Binatia bacterium]|nr:MAG: hypothetical protein KatS3mg077_2428 [Candidatus Binatia bacterium]
MRWSSFDARRLRVLARVYVFTKSDAMESRSVTAPVFDEALVNQVQELAHRINTLGSYL